MWDVALEEVLVSKWHGVCQDLERELAQANLSAAEAGVQAVKDNHPYTDHTFELTNTADAIQMSLDGEAEMVWPMEYASYVNDKEEYEFTSTAEEAARESIEAAVVYATKDASAKMAA